MQAPSPDTRRKHAVARANGTTAPEHGRRRRKHHSAPKRTSPKPVARRRGSESDVGEAPSVVSEVRAAVALLGQTLFRNARALLFFLFRVLSLTVFRPVAWLVSWLYQFPAEVQFKRTTQRFLSVLRSTESYRTYLPTAKLLDLHLGIDTWRLKAPAMSICNAEGLVFEAHVALALAKSGGPIAMGVFVRSMLLRNAHGMTDPDLYPYFTGTKACVEDYCAAIATLIGVYGGSKTAADAQKVKVRPCLRYAPRGAKARTARRSSQDADSDPDSHVRSSTTRGGGADDGPEDLTKSTKDAIRHYRAGRDAGSRYDMRFGGSPSRAGSYDDLGASGATSPMPTVSVTTAPSEESLCMSSIRQPHSGATLCSDLSCPASPGSTLTAGATHRHSSADFSDGLPSVVAGAGRDSAPESQFVLDALDWAAEHANGTTIKPDHSAPGPLGVPCRLPIVDRLAVLNEAYQSYGRTALVLSGGAVMGTFHTGVIRALFEAGVLPDIMSGSSAGSIIAALICTKPPKELKQLIEEDVLSTEALQLRPFGNDTSLAAKFRRFMKTGFIMDVRSLMECMRTTCGDLTFLEAFKLSGRVLNITVTRDQQTGTQFDRHVLLNYLTSPHVVIWSAVSASSALPGLFNAVQLIEKSPETGFFQPYLPGELWCDGSVAQDVPRDRLAQLFNVNYVIVSQVNPHVIPFLHPATTTSSSDTATAMHGLKVDGEMSLLGRLWYAGGGVARHLVLKCFDSGILSKTGAFENLHMLMTQWYTGHITILPIGDITAAVPDYLNIANNPTAEYISYVASRAQARTWPVVARIKSVTFIERALVKEIAFLERALRKEGPGELFP